MRRLPLAALLSAVFLGGLVLTGSLLGSEQAVAAQPKKGKPAKKAGKKAADQTKEQAAGESEPKAAGDGGTKSSGGPKVLETKTTGDGGVKTYKFGPVEVEGRLKSPQVVYFLRRVRAEFAAGALGHRSFMRELSDTRRNPAIH